MCCLVPKVAEIKLVKGDVWCRKLLKELLKLLLSEVRGRVAEDDEAHTSMEMEGGLESYVATLERMKLRLGSEDGLMQDDTELTKVGGSSTDEPVIDSNDKAGAIEIVDESLKGA
nr:hypothetical protein [Tanacetum cinerariifolium]